MLNIFFGDLQSLVLISLVGVSAAIMKCYKDVYCF